MKKSAPSLENSSESDPIIAQRLGQFVSGCSVLAVAFGCWVLAGWMLHIQIVKSILPGQVTVKANTAVCSILTGFALWILRKKERSAAGWTLAAKTAAIIVSVVGLLSLPECLWGWDLGIDKLLFAAGAEDIPGSMRPGLMSPITAFAFFALGAALLLLDGKPKLGRWWAQLLLSGVAIVSLFGVLDFVLDPASSHTHISPVTALTLFLLAFGLLFSRIESGFGALIASPTLGGTLARRLIPAAVLVPLLVGWLRWKGQSAGLYSDWAGVAVLTVLSIVLLASLTAWTASVIDHTQHEQQQTERAHNASEERFRLLLDGVRDYAIYMLDPNGKVISWNAGAENIKGYRAEEILGQHFSCFYTARDRENTKPKQELEQALSLGRVEGVGERVRKDGSAFWANYVIAPLRDDSGGLRGFSKIVRDVSERKRAEEKLHQASLYARSLIEASLDPLVTISREGKITDVNAATEKVTGVSRGQLIGSDFSNYFTDPGSARRGYEQVFAQGAVQDYPLAIRHASGRMIDVLYNAAVFRNEAGEIEGVFAAARDVTERKRAERALRSLSACNESLVRATDEQSLLQRICDLVVNVGGYRMAWVGYAEPDERKTVRAVAESGFEAGYLDTVNITWADEERGSGPTGTAIRTGKAAVCHDAVSDPHFAPWRENAIRRGYLSSLVLPLKSGEQVLGAISVYAAERGAFDAAEQHLLEEMANNLTYGILALRAKAERRRAEEEIRELNQELEKRVQERTAQLHDSERRVRRKLESILSPQGDLASLELADLLDVPALQSLVDDLYKLLQIPMFILDLKGNVLVAVGWQEICTKFHRAHPGTCKNCEESDRELSQGVAPGQFKLYKCKNQLWDVVTPIMLGEQHFGNLFSGQFFFSDEMIDHALFQLQARQYGFDEQEYLAVLARLPRLTREEVETSMKFYTKLAQLLSQVNYSGIKLARSMTETGRVNAELASSVKELEAFTYSVSHDLRAPLRHISGFSKILSEEFASELPPEAQHHVQRIQEGTRRMGLLVDDLLNLARVSRRDLSLQVSGLKSVVDEVLADLASECVGRQIEWKIGDLPFVECDPGLIKQVFHNLLSNAAKFTRPRSPAIVEIGQEDREGMPVVFVRDNGVGFNMKYSDKLFGVFQRLHRAEDFEGTGVGLATVQRIIQKHGGRIWAEAELDKGATFYFTLGASESTELKTKAVAAGDKK